MGGMITRRIFVATWSSRRNMSSRIFVTDWDETATLKDTTALIAGAATRDGVTNVPPFSHFSTVYLEAYSKYTTNCGNKRDSVSKEEEFQRGMWAVEHTSINALEKYGYFKGFPISRFHDLGPSVELRPGFIEFVKAAGCPIYILSVNWCKGLIENVLQLHGVENVTVLANDLEIDDNSVTTGNFNAAFDIRTGYDKTLELAKIRDAHPDSHIFYFGDSSGDVLPILKADYGGVVTGGKGRKVLDNIATVYGLQGKGFVASQPGDFRVFEASWGDLLRSWIGSIE